ncbi:DUF2681 domain-containing protein [Glaesserella parasuis]|uniref:DUF2681 domain-containing protein n=1 Tax=Glaesserella parasuis TaxID=738 RepID=UPI001F23358F|nr:DUF2681 domain-containing protein [Glaesserella parasuis]
MKNEIGNYRQKTNNKRSKFSKKMQRYKMQKIQQTHRENVQRVSPDTVDEQLHAHNYFRDDDRLHSIRADLPKPSGHDGNETPSTSTQSDL